MLICTFINSVSYEFSFQRTIRLKFQIRHRQKNLLRKGLKNEAYVIYYLAYATQRDVFSKGCALNHTLLQ
jgi:radical SAM superfamily enzyme